MIMEKKQQLVIILPDQLIDNRNLIVSLNLGTVARDLPEQDFVRISRSYIVNLRHIGEIMGNSLKIGGREFIVSKKYRPGFFGRFIFLGTRSCRK